MKTRDTEILQRMKRRLAGTRAAVMLEFAFVAPLVLSVAIFAADFTRILRTEQQLEIASRLAADVEAHLADYHGKRETPCATTKVVAKYYLAELAHVPMNSSVANVYVKGCANVVKNPVSFALTKVSEFLSGEGWAGKNAFLKIVGKIFGGIMNFVTFRTVRYITDIVPHDREVGVSVAAYIPTILPANAYGWLGLAEREGGTSDGPARIGVGQFAFDLEGGHGVTAWKLKLNPARRHRVYCFMPVLDSVPVAPETYVRKFKAWCAKQPLLKGLVK